MKFEATCINEGCPTVDSLTAMTARQLLDANHFTIEGWPVDTDGSAVRCPWCGSLVVKQNFAPEDATFPVGVIHCTDDAKKILCFNANPEDPLIWALKARPLVMRHQRGDHGSVNAEVGQYNKNQTGRITSLYLYNHDVLWIVTSADRTQTVVATTEEVERQLL